MISSKLLFGTALAMVILASSYIATPSSEQEQIIQAVPHEPVGVTLVHVHSPEIRLSLRVVDFDGDGVVEHMRACIHEVPTTHAQTEWGGGQVYDTVRRSYCIGELPAELFLL